ncbi:hypothetical protein [Streptomyces sp. RKAG337]|uniref:hypothetical protein n=1 Tax=Streptomyces sp. RKAG337 TaxID=2893404 RepID=UPI002033403D|nr:hypothetical protein [Streptomyces sp. RKAG337]MCM2430989.1 hypothetical protein [Streptomyces sp. RKAG337]
MPSDTRLLNSVAHQAGLTHQQLLQDCREFQPTSGLRNHVAWAMHYYPLLRDLLRLPDPRGRRLRPVGMVAVRTLMGLPRIGTRMLLDPVQAAAAFPRLQLPPGMARFTVAVVFRHRRGHELPDYLFDAGARGGPSRPVTFDADIVVLVLIDDSGLAEVARVLNRADATRYTAVDVGRGGASNYKFAFNRTVLEPFGVDITTAVNAQLSQLRDRRP